MKSLTKSILLIAGIILLASCSKEDDELDYFPKNTKTIGSPHQDPKPPLPKPTPIPPRCAGDKVLAV